MSLTLETVEVTTGPSPALAVIWLHGLGADGHDFEPIVPYLQVPGADVRFVFPHAPVRPVTLNGGLAMRAWYDIVSLDRGAAADEAGIRDSQARTEQLLRRENDRGISTDRIVLAGFSQGGAIALHTGLRLGERLAGILGLSTYLPLHRVFDGEASPQNRETPLFLAHGTEDPMLPAALGEATRSFLQERGYAVTWKTYRMAHAVCPEEIADIREWLTTVAGPTAAGG